MFRRPGINPMGPRVHPVTKAGAACAVAGLIAAIAPGAAQASTAMDYPFVFHDDITGNNEFKSGGNHYWYINPGADSHAGGYYERPTDQTFVERIADEVIGDDPYLNEGETYLAAEKYYAFIDITRGTFGMQDDMMHFGIELFGDYEVGKDGDRDEKFGESTYYRVHLGNDPTGHGGIMLSVDNAKDLGGNFTNDETSVHIDSEWEVVDGEDYDEEIDGEDYDILRARRTESDLGRPMIEFEFNYLEFNDRWSDHAITPPLTVDDPLYLIFEASQGLTGNYHWNEHYDDEQAGSPYSSNGTGNVYQVDTLRATAVVPLPAGVWGGLAAGALMLVVRRRMLRRRV